MIKLDGNTTLQANVAYNSTLMHHHGDKHNAHGKRRIPLPHRNVNTAREEYHFTGQIPDLVPLIVNSSEPIFVARFSIVFVLLPLVRLPACK
ncbi:hypothetical protein LIER_39119 [Lithospermum erythrorhizon]|uniref:Uncharacterized protein n=1 Tax=Lithospermum erythrorhizon TaxID=34254 RepID=A0AAV3QC87_LITER